MLSIKELVEKFLAKNRKRSSKSICPCVILLTWSLNTDTCRSFGLVVTKNNLIENNSRYIYSKTVRVVQWIASRKEKSDYCVRIPVEFRYIHILANNLGKEINISLSNPHYGQNGRLDSSALVGKQFIRPSWIRICM